VEIFFLFFYKCEKYYKTELAFYIQKQPNLRMEEELKFSLGVNYHNDVVLALFIYLFYLMKATRTFLPLLLFYIFLVLSVSFLFLNLIGIFTS
jgi:hypothetical protein